MFTSRMRRRRILESVRETCDEHNIMAIQANIEKSLHGRRSVDVTMAIALSIVRLAIDSEDIIKPDDLVAVISSIALELLAATEQQEGYDAPPQVS